MADVQISTFVGQNMHREGKVINVYSSYANALLHGATGLSTVKSVNKLTGAGVALSQTAKTVGIEADEFGVAHFVIDDGTTEVWLMSNGHWGAPRRVPIA